VNDKVYSLHLNTEKENFFVSANQIKEETYYCLQNALALAVSRQTNTSCGEF